jgi:tetratricopeptide (TPR) repeat protein
MIISQSQLDAVERLYKRGLNLQAFKLAQSIAPLPKWEGTDARILAANLAYNLGAPATSFKWIQNLWRKDRNHAKATHYYALDLMQQKGPLPTLFFIRTKNPDFKENIDLNVWWHCLYAEIFASLHDFEAAETWLNKASLIKPDDSRLWVTKSHILNQQDLYQESLDAAHMALKPGGWNRPGVIATAHGFCLLERYNDALALLTEGAKQLESGWIIKELADLQSELGQSTAALENYEKLLDYMPMREDPMEQWLYARLSTMAYLAKDTAKAIRYADISSTSTSKKFKETLENRKGTEKRVQIKLGFVRQHTMTCAPATLSIISRYWQKKTEHLEIAEEICYDGTPAHSERSWAEKNDYKVKEFTINWENVVELINRRVPITLTTIHPGNGHLQAIIGYDEIRKTFLIRDPYFQKVEEFLVDELLESQQATGPRGMALVPAEHAHLLSGIDLKESRQYDFLFLVEDALTKHDRPRAVELLARMKQEFPGHTISWRAHWALAGYDANHLQILEAVENLRTKFPDDINLKMSYLSISKVQMRRDERLTLLEEFCKSEETHPLLWQMFGYDLSVDARQSGKALRWLYKTLRCMPGNPGSYRTIADVFWGKRKFEEALELYRFAACLNDKNEGNAWSYFLAAHHLQQTEKALTFLKDRFARFGNNSSSPAQTLFQALREMGLNKEAFEVLDEAIEKRPDDAELKIFVAEAKARFGLLDDAKTLLAEAEKGSSRRDWLRISASVSELDGELEKSLSSWREILALEPLAMDAHQNVAFLIAATESKKSAQEYLKTVVGQFPHHRELHKYLLEWMQEEEPATVLPIVEHLIRIDDQDAWSRREMARWLIREKRYEEALAQVENAFQLDPFEPVTLYSRGVILTEMNRRPEAADAYRQSLALSIDYTVSIKNWLELVRTREEKLKVLEFVKSELFKQTSFGEGFLGYYDFAKTYIDSETLLGELRGLLEKRKDLWSAWSVNICQLVDMKRLDEAFELARTATERFPMTHQIWCDLSLVHKVKGEGDEQIKALQKAISLNPNWSFAIQQLADGYVRLGNLDDAKKVLEESLRRLPLDQFLHGYLADVLWQRDEKEAAIETVKKALKLDSEYEWGWYSLKKWVRESGKTEEVEKMAWQVASAKPRDVNSWLTLAKVLDEESHAERQFEAVNQALSIDPFNVRALALKVRNLIGRNLFDKALRVCQTRLRDGHQPELLRYYAAQIEFERGDYKLSVHLLEELTKSAPQFYAAWERLAEIYREIESKKTDYLRVTKAMTLIAPQDPTVFGYYGEACIANGKREDAKTAFRQAIALAPDYEFAVRNLFDLHFEYKQNEQALAVLETMKQFVKTPATTVCELKFGILERNAAEVKRLYKKLCLTKEANRNHLNKAGKAITDANIFPETAKFIARSWKEFLRMPEANENIGEMWIDFCWKANGPQITEQSIDDIAVGSDAWRKAIKVYWDILLENGKNQQVYNFIERKSKVLKSDTEMWASAGYSLNRIKEYKKAIIWFSDWQTREKVEPWMLWNLSLSLRRVGKPDKALVIHQAALNIEKDDTISLHQVMLGLDNASSGNLREAKDLAKKVDFDSLQEWHKYFYFLMMTVIDIFDSAGRDERKRDELIRQMLKVSLSNKKLWSDNIMRDSFSNSLKKIRTLNLSAWKRAQIQIRVWSSYFNYLLKWRI